jgi:hypothetical protein
MCTTHPVPTIVQVDAVIENSATLLLTTDVTVTEAEPALPSVTLCGAPDVPSVTAANVSAAGMESWPAPPPPPPPVTPVPDNGIASTPPPWLTVRLVLSAPAADGRYESETTHEAPAPMVVPQLLLLTMNSAALPLVNGDARCGGAARVADRKGDAGARLADGHVAEYGRRGATSPARRPRPPAPLPDNAIGNVLPPPVIV